MNPVEIKLLVSGALGLVWQWAMFGPKAVPQWVAWGGLGIASILLYWLVTPTFLVDVQADWRLVIWSIVAFAIAAKGWGSGAKSIGLAPASNSVPRR